MNRPGWRRKTWFISELLWKFAARYQVAQALLVLERVGLSDRLHIFRGLGGGNRNGQQATFTGAS